MENILITGGTGFVGRYIAQRFVQDGSTVHIATRRESKFWRYEVAKKKTEFIFTQINLNDKEKWQQYLDLNKITTVIHLATYGSYPEQQDMRTTIQTNVYDSLEFLEACINSRFVTRFISAGSGSEYSKTNGHSDESSPIFSPNIYGRAKATFGLLGEKICEQTKVRFLHTRLFSIYGPFEEPSRLIPKLVSFGLIGQYPPLSNPKIARDFTYVEDVFSFFKIAVEERRDVTGIVNISSGSSVSLQEVVGKVQKIFEIDSLPVWGNFESRPFDDEKWSGDNSLAHKRFNWEPSIGLDTGLILFRDWIREDPIGANYFARK